MIGAVVAKNTAEGVRDCLILTEILQRWRNECEWPASIRVTISTPGHRIEMHSTYRNAAFKGSGSDICYEIVRARSRIDPTKYRDHHEISTPISESFVISTSNGILILYR